MTPMGKEVLIASVTIAMRPSKVIKCWFVTDALSMLHTTGVTLRSMEECLPLIEIGTVMFAD